MKIGSKRLGAAQLNFILDHIEKAWFLTLRFELTKNSKDWLK